MSPKNKDDKSTEATDEHVEQIFNFTAEFLEHYFQILDECKTPEERANAITAVLAFSECVQQDFRNNSDEAVSSDDEVEAILDEMHEAALHVAFDSGEFLCPDCGELMHDHEAVEAEKKKLLN